MRIRKQFLCMCILSLSSEMGYSVNNYCIGHHGRVITDCHCTYARCIFFQSSAFGVQILFQAPRSQVVLSGRLCVCDRTNTDQCKKLARFMNSRKIQIFPFLACIVIPCSSHHPSHIASASFVPILLLCPGASFKKIFITVVDDGGAGAGAGARAQGTF